MKQHIDEKNNLIKKLQNENNNLRRMNDKLQDKSNDADDAKGSCSNLTSQITNTVKRMITEKPHDRHVNKRIKKEAA